MPPEWNAPDLRDLSRCVVLPSPVDPQALREAVNGFSGARIAAEGGAATVLAEPPPDTCWGQPAPRLEERVTEYRVTRRTRRGTGSNATPTPRTTSTARHRFSTTRGVRKSPRRPGPRRSAPPPSPPESEARTPAPAPVEATSPLPVSAACTRARAARLALVSWTALPARQTSSSRARSNAPEQTPG